MKRLLAFGGFADDAQGILAAVYRLALVSVKLRLKIVTLELGVASFADADGRRVLFYYPQFALGHIQSLAHLTGRQ